MKSTFAGRAAETAVAEYLKKQKYQILTKNWRTRLCEIDIVAKKDGIVYFCEVKYRTRAGQGDGFEYITLRKQKQMEFAADVWVNENDWEGDWRLVAAAVSGDRADKIQIIEI